MEGERIGRRRTGYYQFSPEWDAEGPEKGQRDQENESVGSVVVLVFDLVK